MNIGQFFEHWGIRENPFRGEEARDDSVLARLSLAGTGTDDGRAGAASTHSDFDRILGELVRPSTSIVFGERGSGKTAIRMQIAERVRAHNRAAPDAKLFLIDYDDLNPFIAELDARYGSRKDPAAALHKYRLVDHIDAMLTIACERLSAALLGESRDRPAADLGEAPAREARRLPAPLRQELLLLLALYDAADVDGSRARRVRALLRLGTPRGAMLKKAGVWAGWIPAALAAAWVVWANQQSDGWILDFGRLLGQILLAVFALGWAAVLVKTLGVDRWRTARFARRLRDEMHTLPRETPALAASLRWVERGMLSPATMPVGDNASAQRYGMLDRLRRVISRFGYTGVLVLIDRVDEPALIAGDPDKMRAVMWPLFNAKFLQQDRLGVKMLLPIELRHALFRESASFFREARLDKQSLVERLTWTGPMLYDLCETRLNACRDPDAEHLPLIDLFADDVNKQDVIDALDQMHQPRDAFKFLYRCIVEHCSNVTADSGTRQIPRLVLDQVRRAEASRVQELYRGMRPA